VYKTLRLNFPLFAATPHDADISISKNNPPAAAQLRGKFRVWRK